MNSQNRPKILDLFAGCGGFSLGAHAAGFETVLGIDIDSILTSSFNANFPNSKLLLQDIRSISSSSFVEMGCSNLDGVVGGPPCQAFSEMGVRDADDPRRELIAEYFRVVRGCRPKFFVFENVRGLGFPKNIGLLTRELNALGDEWTIVGPKVINAADFGAPTKRLRLFVFGFRHDVMKVPKESDLTEVVTQTVTVKDAIADLVHARFTGRDETGADLWQYDLRRNVSKYAAKLRSASGEFTGHAKTKHTTSTLKRFAAVAPGSVDPVGKYQRLKWDGFCPTLRAGTGNDRGSYQAVRPLHPQFDRVITPREAARLQGFPDSFKFHKTIWHSSRMIGNSVSPVVSEVLMSRILKYLAR